MSESDINLHVVAAFAWIKHGDKYLLAKRASDDPQAGGLWALPGGKIDNALGDGIVQAELIREIKEEVGVSIKSAFKFIDSQGFVRSSGHHVVSIIFAVDYAAGEASPLDGQSEVQWMTKSQIASLLNSDKRLAYLRSSFSKLAS